ncbi:MAG: response regulator transcription factor [Anaerolineales bacterium]|jgi:NarL family two-component system response regulator YdfI
MSDTIRLLIADDHLIVRQGLRLILETEDGFELVGEATDGAEAVQLAGELHPDVILMDLRMPGMDGLTAIEQLAETQPEIAIVILTTFNEDDLMVRGLRAGAKGFLLKDTDRETLFESIRAAARGETLLKPDVMARLLAQTQTSSGAKSQLENVDLTEREMEVLQAAAQGKTSKEIAFALGISERTVKAHLGSIYQKLGVDSRAAAIAAAAGRGWLE